MSSEIRYSCWNEDAAQSRSWPIPGNVAAAMSGSSTMREGRGAGERKPAKDKMQRCWGSLALGCILLALPVVATTVDAKNNWDFASPISIQAGFIAVACAVGLTVLPGVLAMRKWGASVKTLLIVVSSICAIATVFAALNAYLTQQGHEIQAKKGQQAAYANAQADISDARRSAADARAEAARITETSTPAELDALVKEAAARAEREAGRVKCGPICEAAKSEHAMLIARLGQAKAKAQAIARAEKAEKRLDAAKVEAQQGPAEPGIMATKISVYIDGDAHDIEGWLAITLDVLWIMATLFFAMLAYPAVVLIRQGLGNSGETEEERHTTTPEVKAQSVITVVPPSRPIPVAQPVREPVLAISAPQEPKPTEAPAKRKPAAVRKTAASADELLVQFISDCVVAGQGESSPAQIYGALEQWWKRNGGGQLIPGSRSLSKSLADRGISSVKRGGKMVYPARLHNLAPQLVHSAVPARKNLASQPGIAAGMTGTN